MDVQIAMPLSWGGGERQARPGKALYNLFGQDAGRECSYLERGTRAAAAL